MVGIFLIKHVQYFVYLSKWLLLIDLQVYMQDHGRNLCYRSTISLKQLLFVKIEKTMKTILVCVWCVIKAVLFGFDAHKNKNKESIIHCLVISTFSNHYLIYLVLIIICYLTFLFYDTNDTPFTTAFYS